MKVWWLLVLAVAVSCTAWGAPTRVMAPAKARAELARTGKLVDVRVVGDLDLSALPVAPGVSEWRLDGIELQGRLHAKRDMPPVALRIRRSSMRELDLKGRVWLAPLTLVQVQVRESASLEGARFAAPVAWHRVDVMGPARFNEAVFESTVEIMRCNFEPTRDLGSPSFRGARFKAQSRFDHTRSSQGLAFDGARFEADASFLSLNVAGRATWLNVSFAGDTEFRLAAIGEAAFGDEGRMSVFQKLADFRQAKFGSLALDYVDGRGQLLMAGTHVSGLLSMSPSNWHGEGADLRGLRVDGPLRLDGAEFDRLRLHGAALIPAIERGRPTLDTWVQVEAALDAQGRHHEALAVSARRSRQALDAAQADAGVLERPWLAAEAVVWGLGTGFGTRLGRASLTLAGTLALLALPLLLPGALRFPADGPWVRLRVLLHGAFGRPSAGAEPLDEPRWLALWKPLARALGLGALALFTLTLARVSPALQGLLKAAAG